MTIIPTIERDCRDCGYRFRIRLEAFESRGLAYPTRCPDCRARRRAASEQGTVTFYSPRGYGFIEGDRGGRFYFDRHDFGNEGPEAHVGLRVEFTPANSRPNPRARRLRTLDDVSISSEDGSTEL